MSKNSVTLGEVRDQYCSYEDPRFKDTQSYDEHGENFDKFIKAYTARVRAEAFHEAAAELQSNVTDDDKGDTTKFLVSSIWDVAAATVRHLAETEENSGE